MKGISEKDTVTKYSYNDVPTVKRFSESNAFIRGLMGPFRSGKSSGCIIEIVKRGQQQVPGPDKIRRTRWIVVRNTYRQLSDTVIKSFFTWFPEYHWGEWRAADHIYRINAIQNTEIEILFRALDRPDHVANLLSLEVTGAWVNEAREVPWAIIDALQGRVGQYPPKSMGGPTWYGVILDTNPPDVDSAWYEFFEKKKQDPNFAELFKQPSGLSDEAENLNNLINGRNYYLNLSQGKNEEYIKVYIHGQYGFVIDGKPVYPEYNDHIHCDKDCFFVDDLPIYVGMDFGLTPAAIYTQPTETGRWIIGAELIATRMGADNFTDRMIEFQGRHLPRNEFIYIGDPAGDSMSQTDERTCFEICHAKGINIEPGLQNPGLRIESVRKPLTQLIDGQPQFVLHPRCAMTRKGFMGGYQFRRMQVSGERYSDRPDKNQYSHVHDALQYVATRLFGTGLLQSRFDQYEEEEDEFSVNPTRNRITGY